MVLGDGHVDGGGVLGLNPAEVIAAIEETVGIAVRFGGADFDEVLRPHEAHRRVLAVGIEVGEENRFNAPQAALRA